MKDVDAMLGIGASGSASPDSPDGDSSSVGNGNNSIISRYTDAYMVARATVGFGMIVKTLAVILGLVLVVAGIVVSSSSGELAVVIGIAGIIVGISVYILGVLIAAQGQILKATVDTAVNTSSLINEREIRQMMKVE